MRNQLLHWNRARFAVNNNPNPFKPKQVIQEHWFKEATDRFKKIYHNDGQNAKNSHANKTANKTQVSELKTRMTKFVPMYMMDKNNLQIINLKLRTARERAQEAARKQNNLNEQSKINNMHSQTKAQDQEMKIEFQEPENLEQEQPNLSAKQRLQEILRGKLRQFQQDLNQSLSKNDQQQSQTYYERDNYQYKNLNKNYQSKQPHLESFEESRLQIAKDYLNNTIQKVKITANIIVHKIKTKALEVWDYIDDKVLKHFKTKESFKSLVVTIKEKIKSFFMIRSEQPHQQSATPTIYSRTAEALKQYGIDVNELKVSAKKQFNDMVLLGFFNPNKYIMREDVTSTSLKEATRFEIILRDLREWKTIKIIQAYEVITSPQTKEKIQRVKNIFYNGKNDLQQGLVKYKKISFWWQTDSNSWFANSRLKKIWNFRRAQKQGVTDFYLRTIMLVGGFTILFGVWRGRKKGKKSQTHKEQSNQLKMEELALEMEKLKLLIELDRLEGLEQLEKEQSKLQQQSKK
ncbi:UNKNOWN [Stylonychia lemnae]|uniref:Transmembrane protein n=1 Tax=Stylonychia lemnae TaxID=5949 RepID=A0A078ADW8_STYLE|nr:UNKNOWN [Stylonychia lemnae]|eukprot:CDW80404.1 UNKNOWN [Stylonychia lemnae]